jgi:DNA polymerase-4
MNNYRTILHLDLDSFFVSVSRLLHPELKNMPLLIGGTSGRGVVASCSYETRKFGVHSGMPLGVALRLCPEARVLKGDYDDYSYYSDIITQILAERSPAFFEKASIDEFYIDLTGMDRFIGCWKWSSELRHYLIKETGLPLSQCLSVNKLVSKIGTNEAKPNGALEVKSGMERDFIAPLQVKKIPMVGNVTAERLAALGVQTVKKLREVPLRYLKMEFGKNGIDLHRKANAVDNTPVISYSEQKSISTEQTFHADTTDVHFLKNEILKATEELSFELRKLKKLTGCITVKLRYSDFNTYTQQKQIPYCGHEKILIATAVQLFLKLYNRRVLVRLIGVKFSKLVGGNHQLHLYEDSEEEIHLMQKIDFLRNKHGLTCVRRASNI